LALESPARLPGRSAALRRSVLAFAIASRSAAEDLLCGDSVTFCCTFPSWEAWDVRDDACEVGDKTKRESVDGAESVDVDDRSLLAILLVFAPLLGMAGLIKASPTTGRGLEDLAA